MMVEHHQFNGVSNLSSEANQSVVTVNFGLTWKHILGAAAMVLSGITGLGTAGWLVLPAKQADLAVVQEQLKSVSHDLSLTRETTQKLIVAVDDLTRSFKLIRVSSPAKKKVRE